MNKLAFAYNVSPTTLSQVAVNQICEKVDHPKGPATSTPPAALKAQPSGSFRVVSSDADHPCSSKQTPNDSLRINPLPADVQKVIVEHIVKNDSPVHLPSSRELRLFSGNFPNPPSAVDFGGWRLRTNQVLNNWSISEVQQRHTLLDGLLAPCFNRGSLYWSTSPTQCLSPGIIQGLWQCYRRGRVVYSILETHQNNGERASDYLHWLHTLLQEVVESNGVTKQDADSQLLKQFLRGFWDDSLITTLHLKEPLTGPFQMTLNFSELLFRIRTYEREKESQLKVIRQLEAELRNNTPAPTDPPTQKWKRWSEVNPKSTPSTPPAG